MNQGMKVLLTGAVVTISILTILAIFAVFVESRPVLDSLVERPQNEREFITLEEPGVEVTQTVQGEAVVVTDGISRPDINFYKLLLSDDSALAMTGGTSNLQFSIPKDWWVINGPVGRIVSYAPEEAELLQDFASIDVAKIDENGSFRIDQISLDVHAAAVESFLAMHPLLTGNATNAVVEPGSVHILMGDVSELFDGVLVEKIQLDCEATCYIDGAGTVREYYVVHSASGNYVLTINASDGSSSGTSLDEARSVVYSFTDAQ